MGKWQRKVRIYFWPTVIELLKISDETKNMRFKLLPLNDLSRCACRLSHNDDKGTLARTPLRASQPFRQSALHILIFVKQWQIYV